MTIGIYKLTFGNMVYIGQSINIENRYRKHLYLLDKNEASSKLQRAYNIYGSPTLSIIIECSIEELDYMETLYIQEYNSYLKGLNSTPGGIGVRGLKGENNPNSQYSIEDYYMALWYLIQVPKICIKDIAKELDIDSSVIENISSLNAHRWLKDEFPSEYIKLQELFSIHRNSAIISGIYYPDIVSPEGKKYSVYNTSAFAREHNLLQSSLHAVLIGKLRTHRGWHLETTDVTVKIYCILKDPQNNEYIIMNGEAAAFARKYGLTKSGISSLKCGKLKSHKGWTLVE